VPAHHAPDGRFRNPWPDSEPHGFADVLRWMRERRRDGRAPSPARGSFPTATPNVASPRVARDVATATWIGHSTVLLQAGGLNILTDPMFSERAFPVQWIGPRRIMPPALGVESLPPLDVVLLTHSHYDHLDKSSVKRLVRLHPDATWVAPLELGAYLRGFGARNVVELDWWQRAEVRGVSVTATPARHFSARRLGDRNKTLWCGYAVEVAGRRIYFAGDTAYHPEFGTIAERCGPFDFVMMPIGAYDPRWFMHVMHVNPDEAIQACVDLRASHPRQPMPLVLGIHWGTFRLTDEPMDEPPRRAMELWRERGLDPGRLWIARFGETREL
jgi:N-acyl-phosphatidylethanolamine-hydrolysing phospholipase D